ncbi:noroxomaritidine synthase-like [Herrania umbratica]|uniref:Noroxomaritidine synthase-like n=1 Tax=Herrania umbratica TaxID=108875 RepID=A0A6J1B1X6_9ROSI|nr:noroxomaritidine synthase-like [Herrania umbratica]
MGRTEEIWGKDCLEFKPERWISKRGDLIPVPSYKFIPFSAGLRVCLGKDLSFKQMKTAAINVLWHFQVEMVECQTVFPSNQSIGLHFENGLRLESRKDMFDWGVTIMKDNVALGA